MLPSAPDHEKQLEADVHPAHIYSRSREADVHIHSISREADVTIHSRSQEADIHINSRFIS